MVEESSSSLWINCTEGRPTFNKKKKTKTASAVDASPVKKKVNDRVEFSSNKRKNESDTVTNKKLKLQKEDKEVHNDVKETPHAVISSLFHKNPEIPQVEERVVKQIVERIFSTDKLEDLKVHPYIISNLKQSFGVERLTAVQEKTIPHILNGEDVLVKSQTGSGKTLAYAVPIVHKLQEMEPKINRSSGIYVCVILPTRELALQTFEWFQKLLRAFNRIVPACFMGGQKRKSEKASLRRGINVIVTTPQRLIDHLKNSKQFTFSKLKYLVVDEADRLLEMGYEQNVAEIIEEIGKQREEGLEPLVTALLSATLTQGVHKLAGLSMRQPLTIDISSEADQWGTTHQLVTPSNLLHHFVLVPAKLKLVCLITFILWKCRGDRHKILVFLPTQDAVDFYTKLTSHVTGWRNESDDETPRDIYITRLHGNMSQQMRNEVFRKMRSAPSGVLFCTDVCARGLDLPNVDWIVQASAPCSVADYVHRVGRTARIGCAGRALLLLLPAEVQYVELLQRSRIKLSQVALEEVLQALPTVNRATANRKTMESVEEAATELQLDCERQVSSDVGLHDLARKAFVSLSRAYASYPAPLRSIFDMKSLHLGHLAKSLALRDTPSALGAQRSSAQGPRGTWGGAGKRQRPRRAAVDINNFLLDEFQSGT